MTTSFGFSGIWSGSAMPFGLRKAVAVDIGGGFSLALKPDGTAAAWGNNFYDQLRSRLERFAGRPCGLEQQRNCFGCGFRN